MNRALKNVLVILATIGLTTAAMAEASDDKPTPESVLFVQHADTATLSDGTLTLKGVDKNVVVFTDRPHRAAATVPIAELLRAWDEGADSFAADPPNVALVGQSDDGKPVSLVLEMSNPVLNDGAMSFQFTLIEGTEVGQIDHPYLVIDDWGWEAVTDTLAGAVNTAVGGGENQLISGVALGNSTSNTD
ncbi:hypothetical protein SAMN05444358_1011738 [Ruegeria halocynthiae]|uniref:Uncharacterized protein n=1 Tax=Ruegeria halocynthiae TaxID=985054 RepID=A0A1H2WCM8_9RHOB|nr:hypothetical protein [Ruegeria halocynthiae]SDW78034.1 hypothetical protein SAMN05444358_1011738 [Ruegeria halocynthiae]